MNRLSQAIASLLCLTGSLGAQLASGQSTTKTQQIGDITFQFHSDLQLEKVASAPLVKWPVVCEWDSAGDLLVVESGGVGHPIEESNKLLAHRIVKLVDSDGDGAFDKRTVLVEKLPFTEGVLAYRNSIFACAPPQILKFTDTDNDGQYEDREVWFDGKTVTGCANDLHGPYLGRDGWIYWCKGAFAEQRHRYLDGRDVQSWAAHVYRRRPEGGDIEPIATGGMDNPVEVAFNRTGDAFFTSTFLHHPAGGLRDGIAHAVHGGVYGKDHNVINSHRRTGDLMPVMTELGPAAPSGLLCLNQPIIQPQPGDDSEYLVAALFNLQKVTMHKLVPSGSTYTTEDSTLLCGDRIDFHPTDVLEDADGSLLIVDTGGWYNLCCPTSKIDQHTAAGGIYRLSKVQQPSGADPVTRTLNSDTPQSSVEQLVERTTDLRPWITKTAVEEITDLEGDQQKLAVKLLAAQLGDNGNSNAQRTAALWTLSQVGSPDALSVIAGVLDGDESALVSTACHIASLNRMAQFRPQLERNLQSESTLVRRLAAEALGRIGESTSVPLLLDSLTSPAAASDSYDRVHQHSVIYALIEIGNASEILQQLEPRNTPSGGMLAGLIALEQLGSAADIKTSLFTKALNLPDDNAATQAAKVLAKQTHRASEFTPWLTQTIRESKSGESLSSAARVLLRAWISTSEVQSLVISTFDSSVSEGQGQRASGIQRIGQLCEALVGFTPGAEADVAIAAFLGQVSESEIPAAITILGSLDLSDAKNCCEGIVRLAQNCEDESVVLQLISCLPESSEVLGPQLQNVVAAALLGDDTDLVRLATSALPSVKLTEPVASQLVGGVKSLPPRTLSVAIEAVSLLGVDALDTQLFHSLVTLPAARTLNFDQIENLYRDRNQPLRDLLDKTVSKLRQPPADIEASVSKKLAALLPGDSARGMQLFRSSKATCSACHRVGYVGGDIGPELTTIGASRTRAALLEAIMFPSARLEQSFQSTKVLTLDGEVFVGLIRPQPDPQRIKIQLHADKSVLLSAADIELMEPSSVSVMPAGLHEILSDQELADLLAFLESAK